MSDEFIERIEQFLSEHAIDNYRFEQRSKHRVVVIEYRGSTHQVFFPSTGSDRRGPLNAVSTVRHVLGLPTTKVSEAPSGCKKRCYKKRKTVASGLRLKQNRIAEAVSTTDKFYAPLRNIKARLDAMAKAEQRKSDPATLERGRNVDSNFRKTMRLRTPWLGDRPRYAVV
jgi:hypothetical protein